MKNLLSVLGTSALVTCALAAPARADDAPFQDEKYGVTIKPVKGWTVVKGENGALAAATTEGGLAAKLLHDDCDPDKTLASLASDLDGDKSEKEEKLADRKPGEWLWRVFKKKAVLYVKSDRHLFRLRFLHGDAELTADDEKSAKELALAVSLAEPSKEAGKSTDNPWTKAGEGSWVEFKIVSEASGQTTEMTQKQTLTEKGADEITLKFEMKMIKPMAMDLPENEQKMPAKNTVPGAVEGAPKEAKKGEETLEIGEKKLKCKWTEYEFESGGVKTTSKVWTSDEVPGTLVKVETKSSAVNVTMVATDFELKTAKKKDAKGE